MEFFQDSFSKPKNLNKQKKKKSSHIKTLPSTFFEDLLDLEFSLKRNFHFDTLKEIIYMYSVSKFLNF